jgi:hypothetical protein
LLKLAFSQIYALFSITPDWTRLVYQQSGEQLTQQQYGDIVYSTNEQFLGVEAYYLLPSLSLNNLGFAQNVSIHFHKLNFQLVCVM